MKNLPDSNSDGTSQSMHSHLFRLRLWKEELEHDHAEWRGKLEHVTGGEAHYFRTWDDLICLLVEMMEKNSLG